MAYVACFEVPDGRLVQGLARITHAGGADARRAAWSRAFRSLVELLLAPSDSSIAARIKRAPDGAIETTLLATAPAGRAAELRSALGRLTRLETLVPGSIEIAGSRERYDTIAAASLPLQCQITMPRLTSPRGAWIACDFRVHALIDQLLAEGDAADCELQYQVHLAPARPAAEELRAARRNLLALEDLAGVPERLLAHQQALVATFARSEIVLEEFLCVDSAGSAEWLSSKLRQRFAERFSELRVPAPGFDFAPGAHRDQLASGLHRVCFEPLDTDEHCAQALEGATAQQILCWEPKQSASTMRAIGSALAGDMEDGSLASTTGAPEPCHGDAPFVFVSYARRDASAVFPQLARLIERGYRVWYDGGIPGGAEWDALIEDRLAKCALVLLFGSNAAIESKYVRREVKFADVLDKPLLTVVLEDLRLDHGMRMLLTQYQMLETRTADFPARLSQSLEHLLRSAVAPNAATA